MGRGGTPARETSFVSLVAYGPNSDSALTMEGGLQPLKPGRAVPNSLVVIRCSYLLQLEYVDLTEKKQTNKPTLTKSFTQL